MRCQLHRISAGFLTGAVVAVNLASCKGSDSTAPALVPHVSSVPEGVLQAAIGTSGSVSAILPQIKVTDTLGNPLSGVTVTVTTTGGGSVQNSKPKTNSAGIATAGSWTLGGKDGIQTVTLTPAGATAAVFSETTTSGNFTVDIRFIGPVPSPDVQAAFAIAAAREARIVTGRLTSFVASDLNTATLCQEAGLPTLNETIPNLIIFAIVAPIDGVGGILGQSGPCASRTSSSLPLIGLMKFDSADFESLSANGTIASVVTHEMQHVLGFGSMWTGPPYFPTVLLQNPGTANPVYLGALARAEYVAAGGTTSPGVPVEGGNVAGTSNSHWRKTIFGSELMTGYTPLNQFSRISIAALGDLGYTVSYLSADPYTIPGSALRSIEPVIANYSEQIFAPRYKIDALGKITRIGQ